MMAAEESKEQMLILYRLLQGVLGSVGGLGNTEFFTSYPASSYHQFDPSVLK